MKGIVLFFLLFSVVAHGQTDYVSQTFKDTRVVSGHSVETNIKGEAKFIISHRFGSLRGGAYELFGFDQSTIRIGLDYGITDNLTIGIGRSSFEKTFDGFMKYKFIQQSSGEKNFPLTITGMSNMTVEGLRWEDPERENYFTSRLDYAFQLLLSRKISDAVSLQVMPTVVHRNLVPTESISHDVVSIGAAGRFQISKQVSLQVEYHYVPDGQLAEGFYNPLSFGVDIETKGHVFQLHLSNSTGMTEKLFITETRDRVEDFDFHLGFNITRDFRIRGRK